MTGKVQKEVKGSWLYGVGAKIDTRGDISTPIGPPGLGVDVTIHNPDKELE